MEVVQSQQDNSGGTNEHERDPRWGRTVASTSAVSEAPSFHPVHIQFSHQNPFPELDPALDYNITNSDPYRAITPP